MESIKNHILNLNDENLLEMLRQRGDYVGEAIEIALAECAERGLPVPEFAEKSMEEVRIRRGYFDLFFSGFLDAYRDFLRRHFGFLFFLSLGLVLLMIAGFYLVEAFEMTELFSGDENLSENLYLLVLVNSFYATVAILLYSWKTNRVQGTIQLNSFFSMRMESRVTSFAFSLLATAAAIFLLSKVSQFLLDGDLYDDFLAKNYGNPLAASYSYGLLHYSTGSKFIYLVFSHLFTLAGSLIPAIAVTSGLKRQFGISWIGEQRLPWPKIILATLLGTILVKAIALLLTAQVNQISTLLMEFNDIKIFIQMVAVTFMQVLLFPAYVALLAMPFMAAGIQPEVEEESPEDENEELFQVMPLTGNGGPQEVD